MAGTDDTRLEHKVQIGPDEAEALHELFDAVAAVDGPPSIDADAWADLTEHGRQGLTGIVAYQAEYDRPVGYAQVFPQRQGWSVEVAVPPEMRRPTSIVGEELARAAVAVVARAGGGGVQMWLAQPRRADERVAAAAGLTATRTLYQVRRTLPVDRGLVSPTKPIETRPFRSGHDESAWLDVNNRAFARHPEQGGWDLATVARREAERWFDPAGFLLLELEDRLAGFCWTKVHHDEDPVQGEIYVIAVDPDFEGLGLGRALTVAGLDHLAGRGITVGMLYVDATNVAAVKLYADLGFVVDHVNRAYTGTVQGQP